MFRLQNGSIHLARILGIDLFLHWTWFLAALYEIELGQGRYSSPLWNAIEYLFLFGIVLTHEFGHALACRSVGGEANRIMLWPLGGVAYVNPPQRPGATLWSIAAGPLVNVVLAPLLFGCLALAGAWGWRFSQPDFFYLLRAVFAINLILLLFNLLPVYPLDGGQILRSLLWFFLGRARSLMTAAVLGVVGVAGFFLLALGRRSFWMALLAAYAGMRCWAGFRQAQILRKLEKLPRRPGFACPHCRVSPPQGAYWRCNNCQTAFDTFEARAVCPHCGAGFASTICMDCQSPSPIGDWEVAGGSAIEGQ